MLFTRWKTEKFIAQGEGFRASNSEFYQLKPVASPREQQIPVLHVKYGIFNFVAICKLWTKLVHNTKASVSRLSDYQNIRKWTSEYGDIRIDVL
jgi:hypothetical protein